MIPYGHQSISEQDVQAVVDVLRSDFLTQGPAVPRFERLVADYCGAPQAVAVSSATAALHIACLALGVGPGDRVWTSANTFVASANCARYCGATVDFVDIDPLTYNMSLAELAQKLEHARAAGTLPKVVIPVHFAGQPCDMEGIRELSRRYGFRTIEDASHAIGARYADTTIGDCRYSDIVVFSFHPVKIITTAEGGMALTRDAGLADEMRLLRTHGITREPSRLSRHDEGPWYYEQQRLGFNYRMTDIQAALGCSQMVHLERWVTRRHEVADRYEAALRDFPVVLPARVPGSRSALHLYPIQVENRRQVFDSMRASGIGVNVHYIPVHTQPDFQRQGRSWQLPRSEAYYARALSLPMFPALRDDQQEQVIQALADALAASG